MGSPKMGSRFNVTTKDPAINVTAWFFMTAIVLSVITRLGTKYHLFKKLLVDDFLILASAVFAIAQGIAVSFAVASGYGYHYDTVLQHRREQAMKSLYAANFLYILSLASSKLSLTLFIRNLTPNLKDEQIALAVQITIAVWAVVCIFVNAFQCSIPETWNIWEGRCFNLLAWRYFVAGSNIITDILIVIQAAFLVKNIQTKQQHRRMVFIAIFLPRLCVPAATVVQIAFIKKGTITGDPTYSFCENTIIEGVIQCVSIMTACWGQLKPFISWMRSNGLKITQDCSTASGAYKFSAAQSRKSERSIRTGQESAISAVCRDQILVTREWDVNSQSSQANIIPGEIEYNSF